MKSVLFMAKTGCLLPLIIIFNLFFGWMFLKPVLWLSIELILILLFIINSYILAKHISKSSSRRDNAIDVKGEVMKDNSEKEV